MAEMASTALAAVVLVHGGFVDGSGWEDVYKILKQDGYKVSIVQNPTLSLADDVAATKRVLAAQSGPVILVGHSYGGVVITEAGNDPKVTGLVYIAAFAPDKGESVAALIKDPQPGAPVPPILPPQDGYLFLDKAKFAASFAADVAKDKAEFMANSQVPWGRCGSRRHNHQSSVEVQAELVLDCDRGQDDPSRGPAGHVEARGLDGGRGKGQSRHLRVEASSGGRAHRERRQRCETGRELNSGSGCSSRLAAGSGEDELGDVPCVGDQSESVAA